MYIYLFPIISASVIVAVSFGGRQILPLTIDDIITTGSGNDVIILRAGDGGSSLSGADIIKDFTDGLDSFGLADGLQYSDLTIAQGTADNANNTIISKGSEYLAIVENFAFGSMTEVDTTTI